MRAVLCKTFCKPEGLVVEDVPEPGAPGAGQVRVRIAAAGVQFVDVLMIAGEYQFRPEPTFIPGMEAAGTIEAVGDGVEGIAPGDKVITRHRPGAFCEKAVIDAGAVLPMPANLGFAQAAGFTSAYSTAYHSLVQGARLKVGETVLIHGAAGGIGLAAVQIAKLMGATVIATASRDDKLKVVGENGADHLINYSEGGFRDKVKELTGGRGADVVYDPVGGDVFDESMRCINWGARLLILGFTGGRPALAKTNHLLIKGASAIGIRMGGFNEHDPELARENMNKILQLAADGKVKPHVSHTFPLEEVAEAMQVIVDRKVVGKCVLEIG